MVRYVFDKAQRVAVSEFHGELDYAAMLSHMKGIWADPDCNNRYSAICDLRKVKMKMSPQELEGIFFQILADERSVKGPCALLISTPLETALGFIFRSMAENEQSEEAQEMAVQIFYEWENACNFVNCTLERNAIEWKIIE